MSLYIFSYNEIHFLLCTHLFASLAEMQQQKKAQQQQHQLNKEHAEKNNTTKSVDINLKSRFMFRWCVRMHTRKRTLGRAT